MAWHRPGDKPLSEPMMVVLPKHVCVNRPQWVNFMQVHRAFWVKTTVYIRFGSISFTPSLITKWHDCHRYLSIHHVPYLMSLTSPRHCSKTSTTNCISTHIIGDIEHINGVTDGFFTQGAGNVEMPLSGIHRNDIHPIYNYSPGFTWSQCSHLCDNWIN